MTVQPVGPLYVEFCILIVFLVGFLMQAQYYIENTNIFICFVQMVT